jgi:hypothetical protein
MEYDNASDKQLVIPLTKGYETSISAQDFKFAEQKWCACVGRKRVYAYRAERGNNKKKIYLGRAILEVMLGRPLIKGESCHYIDNNPLNNVRSNLQLKSSNKLAKNEY